MEHTNLDNNSASTTPFSGEMHPYYQHHIIATTPAINPDIASQQQTSKSGQHPGPSLHQAGSPPVSSIPGESLSNPIAPFHVLQYKPQWDTVVKGFLSRAGLLQAMNGFERDMLVMNLEWEQNHIPTAIEELISNLHALRTHGPDETLEIRTLDQRKLDYVHHTSGFDPRSSTSINRSISAFLAENRARNDTSNRAEFLQSPLEKRRRLNNSGRMETDTSPPSCARTDPKKVDRDMQMKYDIAKNEDGPLRRTVKSEATDDATIMAKQASTTRSLSDSGTSESNPVLDERLANIEAHLAVRYVPSRPRLLLDRLKYLEDHIAHLEKNYPPWAALHFNQPHRGWPPPPRPTPIIIPSHLTSHEAAPPGSGNILPQTLLPQSRASGTMGPVFNEGALRTRGKVGRVKSSLHQAVMEKLEVQKAMDDLAGSLGDLNENSSPG